MTPANRNADTDSIIAARKAYAWDWFQYHAGQRISMINFFIVTVGVFAAAIATLISAHHYDAAIVASAGGMFICLWFWRFDVRSRELVKIGEHVLIRVENEWLFEGDDGNKEGGSILVWDDTQSKKLSWVKKKFTRFSGLVLALQLTAGALFLLALGYSVMLRLGSGATSTDWHLW